MLFAVLHFFAPIADDRVVDRATKWLFDVLANLKQSPDSLPVLFLGGRILKATPPLTLATAREGRRLIDPAE